MMGQVVSGTTRKDSYTTDAMNNLEKSEQSFNASLRFDVHKNRNKQLVLDMGNKELRRVFMKKFARKKINILKLNDNYLRTLPHQVACMTSLTQIYLQHNNFKYVPVPLCSLIKLEILDMSFNQLESLPYTIGNLISLTVLNVSYNDISSVPENFRQLSNLTDLDCSCNSFTALPHSIFSLSNLKRLNVGNNKLTYLPKDFVRLITLEELNVHGNRIKRAHTNLKDYLTRLKVFHVSTPGDDKLGEFDDTCDGPRDRYLVIRNMLYPEKDSTFRKLPKIPQASVGDDICSTETKDFEGYILMSNQGSDIKDSEFVVDIEL